MDCGTMKQIPGYQHYFIDTAGDVWSTARGSLRLLKTAPDRLGYPTVCLYGGPKGNKRTEKVSRLVATAYIPNPDNLSCVCHKDDVITNNNVNNLFWGSHQDNMTDKMNKGRHPLGDDSYQSKLYAEDILSIRADPRSCRIIGEQYGVSIQVIWYVKKRRTWKHIK
jgi:hypothetical protein